MKVGTIVATRLHTIMRNSFFNFGLPVDERVGTIVAINYSSLALLTNTSFWLILLFWFTDKSGENSCHGDFGWFWLVFNGVAWVWLVLVLEWHGSKCNTVILKNAQIWKSKNPRKKNKHCKVRYWQAVFNRNPSHCAIKKVHRLPSDLRFLHPPPEKHET